MGMIWNDRVSLWENGDARTGEQQDNNQDVNDRKPSQNMPGHREMNACISYFFPRVEGSYDTGHNSGGGSHTAWPLYGTSRSKFLG